MASACVGHLEHHGGKNVLEQSFLPNVSQEEKSRERQTEEEAWSKIALKVMSPVIHFFQLGTIFYNFYPLTIAYSIRNLSGDRSID